MTMKGPKRIDGLRCPGCTSGQSYTMDSRPTALLDQFVTRRRRRCNSCNARWTTYEISIDDLRKILDLTTEDVLPDGEELVHASGEDAKS